jgi:hypothetical protein
VILHSDSSTTNNSEDSVQNHTPEAKKSAFTNVGVDIETRPAEVASLFELEEYQISPVFAELLHNVYRSNWFRITSPGDSIMIRKGDNVLFSWETNINEPIYFDVLDRNGKVIYRKSGAIVSPWEYTPKLSPAIYMYRFSTKNQPIWMGVVIIFSNNIPL